MVTRKQVQLLKLIYEYRFTTIPLINNYFQTKDHTYLFKSLKNLIDSGLIARKYNSNFKLQHKAAIYYLTKKGLDLMSSLNIAINSRVVHLYYGNSKLSYNAINQNLNTMATAGIIKDRFGDQLVISTRYDLYDDYDYMSESLPNNKPDLVIAVKDSREKCFLFYITNKTVFESMQRLKEYIKYFNNGNWSYIFFPDLIFITKSKKFPQYVKKFLHDNFYSSDDRPNIYVVRSASVLDFSKFF